MSSHLEQQAKQVRQQVLDMIFAAQTSHIGSNFSCTELLVALYNKANLKKDTVIVSKGWVAATVYAILVNKGLLPKSVFKRYCKANSPYIGLLEPMKYIPCAGGSMGYGLPFGVGFALAKKMKKEEGHIYVLMSDGEQQIGTTWESALLAVQHSLKNLTVIVDYNSLQAMGPTHEILSLFNLSLIWQSFGWDCLQIKGHSFPEINMALDMGHEVPSCIIAHTTKGKGVSFMENNNLWHYANVKKDDYENTCLELNKN